MLVPEVVEDGVEVVGTEVEGGAGNWGRLEPAVGTETEPLVEPEVELPDELLDELVVDPVLELVDDELPDELLVDPLELGGAAATVEDDRSWARVWSLVR